MTNSKWWPFVSQRDYDAFMSGIKGDNRNIKDAAINAWIEARNQQGSKHGTES